MFIYIHIYIYMFKSTNDRLPWEPILKLAFRKCGCSTRMHFLYFCTQSCLFQNPCLTNERIMSHTWMSHVSRMSEKELRVFLGGDLINEKSYDVTMPGTIGYHQKKAFSIIKRRLSQHTRAVILEISGRAYFLKSWLLRAILNYLFWESPWESSLRPRMDQSRSCWPRTADM